MEYRKSPFRPLEGRSGRITVLWLIGKAGQINITELINKRYASPDTVYRAKDALMAAGLVERFTGEDSSLPLRLTEAGTLLYNSCILKALEILKDTPDSP